MGIPLCFWASQTAIPLNADGDGVRMMDEDEQTVTLVGSNPHLTRQRAVNSQVRISLWAGTMCVECAREALEG